MMREWFTRRAVRQYSDKPVEAEKIEAMLRAGCQAPSAGNGQPWEFIVVRDKGTLSRLAGMSGYSSPAGRCQVCIVLLAHEARKSELMWQQDMAACAQNILLEATYQQLGAVWMGVAPHQPSVDYVRELFSLPAEVHPFALIAAGYPAEGQGNHFVDRYDAQRVHVEQY